MNTNERLETNLRAQATNLRAASEPPAGHRARFAERLDAERKAHRHRRRLWLWTASAAAVAAAVLTALLWSPATPQADTPTQAQTVDSPAEVQSYYALRLDHELAATRALVDHAASADRQELLDELRAMQAEGVPDVQLTDDERITLIVRVYTSKIDALKHIQSRLSTNNHNHNKEES